MDRWSNEQRNKHSKKRIRHRRLVGGEGMKQDHTYTPPFTITSEILNLVSEISAEAAKLELLSPRIITPKLRKAYKIQTITGTLEIEGNRLGAEKVTALLEGKRVLGSVREIAEVQGAIRVYDALDTFDPHKLDDLLRAHKMLMGEILTDAGEFRSSNVGVGGSEGVVHVAPPFLEVPRLMHELFAWLQETDSHPLIASAVFHYEFEFIHPFSDGNGRIGRLWQTLILDRYKPVFSAIPVESVIREHQQAYYEALEASGSAGESTPFIAFMLKMLLETITDTLESDQVNDYVSDQVKKLLEVMGDEWLSSAEIMEKLGLSHRPTFRKNYLNPAIERGLIEMRTPESPRNPKQKYRKRP